MWYHDGVSRYQEVSCDLESLTSLDDVFSHAAISSTWSKGRPSEPDITVREC
jgi:hypothetical protein